MKLKAIHSVPEQDWKAFVNDDKKAFARLYDCYFDGLFAYGARFSRNKEQVKECIQEMFLKLWRNRNNLQHVEHVEHYLMVSLRNIIFDKLSYKTQFVFEELEEDSYDFDLNFAPENKIINNEEQQLLYEYFRVAFKVLTPRQREIIYLRYLKEMDYEKVASIMNITVKAAYKLTARSLETLRDNMKDLPASRLLLLLPALLLLFPFS